MTFLLDANLSPRLVDRLRDAGYAATHVGEVGLLTARDETIFNHAAEADLIVITADTDFSMLLALRNAARPSVVLLRHVAELRAQAHGDLILANLPLVIDDLRQGAIVSLSPTRLAVRRLPMDAASPNDPAG